MPAADEGVRCPECDHEFRIAGNRSRATFVVACGWCPNLFETSNSNKRFCDRACQLGAYTAARRYVPKGT